MTFGSSAAGRSAISGSFIVRQSYETLKAVSGQMAVTGPRLDLVTTLKPFGVAAVAVAGLLLAACGGAPEAAPPRDSASPAVVSTSVEPSAAQASLSPPSRVPSAVASPVSAASGSSASQAVK